MGLYPKKPYEIGFGRAALYPGRTMDHVVVAKVDLPCTTIVIHGVNDVGVSYGAVEAGLCKGMSRRLKLPDGAFKPNRYRDFTDADRDKLEPDPDAIFFKRMPTADAHSYVVPFYWGFRELTGPVTMKNGQYVDSNGNRLDKDYSKEGGPFANATNSLPDLWNRGFGGVYGLVDKANQDPLRPVLDAPGRMYMVLAAQRLAMLIQMIRDYDPDETVNIVAHSQGCMVSLLAQAFLLQAGRKPADALIMNNPPYSLEDELPFAESIGQAFAGGSDAAMDGQYDTIAGIQTLNARLRTLVNIVKGVADNRHTQPEFQALQGPKGCTVGTKWAPGEDRDNRGKVYLYFSPEDATVALNVTRGIGWQGVPDIKWGNRLVSDLSGRSVPQPTEFKPLSAIGPNFLQRVFTKRLRAPASGGAPQPVLVGAAPCDFALCLKGEEGYGHVNPDSRGHRGTLKPTDWPVKDKWLGIVPKPETFLREGIRSITGEALPKAVAADLDAGALPGSGGRDERPDAIDAAIAATSQFGPQDLWQLIPAVSPTSSIATGIDSPCPSVYAGSVAGLPRSRNREAYEVVNAGKTEATQKRPVDAVYVCLDLAGRITAQWLVKLKESADEVRLREQHGVASRSYHSAIFGSALNHEQVTTYDLAIGQGKAVSNPYFRAYLCTVADWRLKKTLSVDSQKQSSLRPGILTWDRFLFQFNDYYSVEPPERKALIEGTSDYYSTGKLPDFLPTPPNGLPPTIANETDRGTSIEPNIAQPANHASANGHDLLGENLA